MNVLLILDGASEPRRGDAPTSLEAARTPVLDALAAEGDLARLRTVPEGLPAGSEVAIPVLLGWVPSGPVARGPIEAAARDVPVPPDASAWRVDVRRGEARAGEAETARAAEHLRSAAPGFVVHRLAGHRLLVTGPPPLPAVAWRAPFVAWPEGERVPRSLDGSTAVVAAAGAAAGIARLMGAHVVIPEGATGGPDTDLAAKAAASIALLDGAFSQLVVHLGGADEAAHARDARGKIAFLGRADRELVAPLVAAVRSAGATLRVCADHGCDPRTGEHDADPVPALDWPGSGRDASRRLTERHVEALPVTDLTRTAVAA